MKIQRDLRTETASTFALFISLVCSIFAFRCMVKLPLIGTKITPAIALKFSGLV